MREERAAIMKDNKELVAITLSRQLGAGAATVGQRLAKRLGLNYLDSNVLRMAAEKYGAAVEDLARWDEHRARFWDQLGRVLAIGAPEALWQTLSAPVGVYDRDVFNLQRTVIREIAFKESCVVIGRAGFWILRDHPGLVSVYLHAPVEARLNRVKDFFHVDDAGARKMIAEIDTERAKFLREMTGESLHAERMHLCIDTGRISLETTEEIIVRAVEQVRCGLQMKTS
jgi:CMP/dCMP kinase